MSLLPFIPFIHIEFLAFAPILIFKTRTSIMSTQRQAQRRQRVRDSRTISTKSAGPSKNRREPADAIGQASVNVLRTATATARPLPGAVDVERAVNARAFEIRALQAAMRSAAAASTTRAFQSLPRHLRRRAASHDPRRVPKRLRTKAQAEIDPNDPAVKLRRRRAKLRSRAAGARSGGQSVTDRWRQRQVDKAWLETHVWHAKRMKMETLWGHRIALTPTLKSHRPAFRAARRSCIVHDASYYAILELRGRRDDLVGVLSGIIGPGTGAWTGGKYESGGRSAQLTLYRYQAWPLGLLGPAEIIWDAASNDETRRIWIRVHPAMFDDVHEAIAASASAVSANSSASELHLSDLRGDLCSFELMGPKTIKVLKGVLKLAKASNSSAKRRFWDDLDAATPIDGLPENMVIGLTVDDPRLRFPPENLKSKSDKKGKNRAPLPSAELAKSSLWEATTRERLLRPRFRKADLDKRRNQGGIPGVRLEATAEDNRVPIMLVRRTVGATNASDTRPFHGFTLYVPAGWGMPFWQSLVFTGSLVGGLKERSTQYLEACSPSFPEHLPLTPAGQEYWRSLADTDHERWSRRPPAKRPNFEKLGVKSPWQPDMKLVVAGLGAEPWLLTGFLASTPTLSAIASTTSPGETLATAITRYRRQSALPALEFGGLAALAASACILVDVQITGRGSPSKMAEIHLEGQDGLIGYCLSGNYSLTTGRGHALAVIVASKWTPGQTFTVRNRNDDVFREAALTPVA